MWWVVAFISLLVAVGSFIGVLVCMLKYNRIWIKRLVISFLVSFAIAFVSVGLAGINVS